MYRQFVKGPRSEYRLLERQRVEESVKLADKFPHLKLMSVNLDYSCPHEVLKNRRLKYSVNLANAKCVFLFGCPNDQCIRGDFDLTQELAEVIGRSGTVLSGEICCPGWLSREAIDVTHCPNRLRYQFRLTYLTASKRRR